MIGDPIGLDPEMERLGVFLSGAALEPDAGALGDQAAWLATAREYLARAVAGASGAATVRVSAAALTVLLSHLGQQEVARG